MDNFAACTKKWTTLRHAQEPTRVRHEKAAFCVLRGLLIQTIYILYVIRRVQKTPHAEGHARGREGARGRGRDRFCVYVSFLVCVLLMCLGAASGDAQGLIGPRVCCSKSVVDDMIAVVHIALHSLQTFVFELVSARGIKNARVRDVARAPPQEEEEEEEEEKQE